MIQIYSKPNEYNNDTQFKCLEEEEKTKKNKEKVLLNVF